MNLPNIRSCFMLYAIFMFLKYKMEANLMHAFVLYFH